MDRKGIPGQGDNLKCLRVREIYVWEPLIALRVRPLKRKKWKVRPENSLWAAFNGAAGQGSSVSFRGSLSTLNILGNILPWVQLLAQRCLWRQHCLGGSIWEKLFDL